jgi:hypothetical protein
MNRGFLCRSGSFGSAGRSALTLPGASVALLALRATTAEALSNALAALPRSVAP